MLVYKLPEENIIKSASLIESITLGFTVIGLSYSIFIILFFDLVICSSPTIFFPF